MPARGLLCATRTPRDCLLQFTDTDATSTSPTTTQPTQTSMHPEDAPLTPPTLQTTPTFDSLHQGKALGQGHSQGQGTIGHSPGFIKLPNGRGGASMPVDALPGS